MSSQYLEIEVTSDTRDIHRAIASLQEELEAVDYYQQRHDTATDAELKAILDHNRNEEVEHAVMLLEWLRRRVPQFDQQMKTYLFSSAPITQIEDAATEGVGVSATAAGDLGIGKIR